MTEQTFTDKDFLDNKEQEARKIAEDILPAYPEGYQWQKQPCTLALTKAILEGKLVKPMSLERIKKIVDNWEDSLSDGYQYYGGENIAKEFAQAIFMAQRGE